MALVEGHHHLAAKMALTGQNQTIDWLVNWLQVSLRRVSTEIPIFPRRLFYVEDYEIM